MIRILLTLIICAYVAFAPAYALAASEDVEIIRQNLQTQIDKLESNLNYKPTKTMSVGAAVEVQAKKTYPITVYDPNHPNVKKATLEAAKTATATVAPSAARIAKSLGRGIAPVAVSMALTEILGKAVDYVLDPANNTAIVKGYTLYKNTEADEYLRDYSVVDLQTAYVETVRFFNVVGKTNFQVTTCQFYRDSINCFWRYTDEKYADRVFPWDKTQTNTVTLDKIAQTVQNIANNSNHKDAATAQSAIREVVQEMITNNEIDNSYFDSHVTNDTYNDVVNNYITNNYNNVSNVTITQTPTGANVSFNTTGPSTSSNNTNNTNNTNSSSNTNTSTGTGTGTGTDGKDGKDGKDGADGKDGKDGKDAPPFELPAFCDWATVVCDWIKWTKEEPDLQDEELPEQQPKLKNPAEFDHDYISVNAQCPPDVSRAIPLPGASFNLVFQMSPVCDFASTYLRPVIIFLAYIFGALSIANAFKVG